jgi:hypothetical protein
MPFRIVIHRPACSLTARRSCRAAHKDALRHQPTSRHGPDSMRSGARKSASSLALSAQLVCLVRRAGWAALGLVRLLRSSYEQDSSPAGRGPRSVVRAGRRVDSKTTRAGCTCGWRLSRWLSSRYSSLLALSPLYIWGSSLWYGGPCLPCSPSTKQRQPARLVSIQGTSEPSFGLAAHSDRNDPATSDDH